MRRKGLICWSLCLSLIISSCSKTKYSGVKQYKTNFISYYNTYFNVKQLYKVGYRESVSGKQESTGDIISVFDYENDPELFTSTAQFKNTTPKVTKLLAVRPYNKWMDDAVLIEGKIRYLKGDLDSAVLLLSYLVDYYPKGYYVGHLPGGRLKGFDEKVRAATRNKEPIHQPKFKYKFARNEGIIWLAKAYIKIKSYDRASNLIYTAEADMGFPIEYRKDLLKTKVMLDLAKEDYEKAYEHINTLLGEYKLSKKEKGRMYFILGQLNEKEKKYAAAKDNFEKALENKLRGDLEFEAKLRMLSYAQSDSEGALSALKKMLNKGKYEQNADKIYFAMGNIMAEKNQIDKAIEYYRKALASAKNQNQKFIVFEKMASIFYDKTNYVLAAKYYDSAQQIIPQSYPNKKDFFKKVEALNRLLAHYNKYIENDSILELAALGPEKAKDKIEKEIKRAYEKEKAKELQLETEALNSQTVASTSLNPSGGKQWYFSTKENIDRGRILFQKKWGKLLLKDNWHRSSASADNMANTANKEMTKDGMLNNGEEMSTDIVAEVEANKLPFSKEAKKPLISEVQKALVAMARIYHYEIKDLKKAIETYEILFSKYGENLENEDEHLYSLYRLYLETDKADKAEDLKAKLIKKFPQSKYSLYALNPNAKSDDEKSDLAVAKRYKETYGQYQKAFYSEALDMCNALITDYPDHKLVPKVKLLRAFIYSYTNNPIQYESALKDILAAHNTSDEAKVAQEYLDLFYKLKKGESPATPNEFVPVSSSKEDADPSKPLLTKESEVVSVPQKKIPVEQLKENTPVEKKVDLPPKEDVNTRKTTETISSNNTKQTQDGLQIVNYYYKPETKHYVLFYLNKDLKETTAKNLSDVYLKTNYKNSGYKAEIVELEHQKFIAIGGLKNLAVAIDFYNQASADVLFQKLVYGSDKYYISSENLDILYISSGWEQYVSFYNKNYR